MLKNSRFDPEAASLLFAAILMSLLQILITRFISIECAAYFAPAYSVFMMFAAAFMYGARRTVVRTAKIRLMHGHGRDALLYLQHSIRVYASLSLAAAAVLALLSVVLKGIFSPEKNIYLVSLLILPAVIALSVSGMLCAYFESAGMVLISILAFAAEAVLGFVISLTAGIRIHLFGDRIAALLRSESYGSLYGAVGAAAGLSIASLIVMAVLLVLYFMLKGTVTENILKESIQVRGQNTNAMIKLAGEAPAADIVYFLVFCAIIPSVCALFNLLPGKSDIISNTGIFSGVCLPWILAAAGICLFQASGVFIKAEASVLNQDKRAFSSRFRLLMRILVFLAVPSAFYLMASARALTEIFGIPETDSGNLILRLMAAGAFFFIFSVVISRLGMAGGSSYVYIVSPVLAVITEILISVLIAGPDTDPAVAVMAGFAAAGIVSALSAAVIMAFANNGRGSIRMGSEFWVRCLITAVCSLTAAVPAFLICEFLTEVIGGTVCALLSLVVFTVIFLAMALITGTADDSILQKIPGGNLVYLLSAVLVRR